jgi:protein-tyrosine phosphatase
VRVPAFRVLFVCVGNVCRSPLGERLLRSKLPADGFEVASAGMYALAGQPMSPRAAAQLEQYGGDPAGFQARQLDSSIALSSDLILVATAELRSQVLAEWPALLRRTFTVREFAALLDVVCPSSGSGLPSGSGRSSGSGTRDAEALRALVAEAQARRSEVRGIDYDIPDPFRQADEAHQLAARLMHDAVERIARGLGAP